MSQIFPLPQALANVHQNVGQFLFGQFFGVGERFLDVRRHLFVQPLV